MILKYKIKLINGAMRNRELQLPLGNLAIGTEDNDVVYFPLEQGLTNFILDTRDEGVFLLSPMQFWVEGNPEDNTEEFLLPLDKVIDVAGCAFIIGDLDQTIPLPDVPVRQRPLRSKKTITILACGFLVALTVSAAVGGYFIMTDKMEPMLWNRQDVYYQLKKQKLHAITLVWQDKNVAVFGRCNKTEDLNYFFKFLKGNDILYRNHTICNDQIFSVINDILIQFGYSEVVVSTSDRPGFFKLSGYIFPSNKWSEVEDLLLNTPGISGWEIHNDNNQTMNNIIDVLRKNNLINYLSISKKENVIIVAGAVPKTIESKILSLIKISNEDNKNVNIIFQNIQPYVPKDIFPAQVIRISGTVKNPVISLDNGTSLSVGSILNGGYVIDSIDPGYGINISRPDEYLHIPVSY